MNTVEFLKQRVSLFGDFSKERLENLVKGSRLTSFEANDAIAHQGEEATYFGVVLSGAVTVSVIGNGGTRQILGRLNQGDTFGEMALMSGRSCIGRFHC